MFARLSFFRRRVAVRWISVVLLVSLCASVVPLPVGSKTPPDKDPSQPFPCQHHGCGCRTAEQCWKKCCCMTHAQKVAWAKRNQVIPPAEVVEAAAQEKHGRTCQAGGCCGKAAKTRIALKSNPRTRPTNPTASASTLPARKADRKTVVVIGALVEKCQGHSWSWNSLPWTIIAIAPEIPRFVTNSADQVIPCSEAAAGLTLEPPVPPPRCSSPLSVVA